MKRHLVSGLSIAAGMLAVLTTGCGKDAAPTAATPRRSEMTSQAAKDIAAQFGSTLSRQNGLAFNRVGGTTLQAMARGQGAVASRTGEKVLTDEAEFSWSFSVTFFDADGRQQITFDPSTTARLAVLAKARGRVTTAEQQASIGTRRSLDVDGILPAETEIEIDGALNDTASCLFKARDGSLERRYFIVASGSLTDVRQLKDETVNPYPLSGTAKWQVTADAFERNSEGEASAHYEASVEVTFNGTEYPTITVDKRWRYSVDLETGAVTEIPS